MAFALLERMIPKTMTIGDYSNAMHALHTVAEAMQELMATFYEPKTFEEWCKCSCVMQVVMPEFGPGMLRYWMGDLREEVMTIENARKKLFMSPSRSDTHNSQEMDRLYTNMQVVVRVVQQVYRVGRPIWSPRHDRTRQGRGSLPSSLCARPRWILPESP